MLDVSLSKTKLQWSSKILIGEKYEEVIGVHMLGNPSSEMIYGACLAIEQEMTLEDERGCISSSNS